MRFLTAIKPLSTTSFEGEVKLFVPCRNILRHVKEQYGYEKRYFVVLFGGITRELWWTTQEFHSIHIIPPWLPVLMYHLRDEHYANNSFNFYIIEKTDVWNKSMIHFLCNEERTDLAEGLF
jgi:hypothetical protein